MNTLLIPTATNMVDKYDATSMYVLNEIPSTDNDYKLINKCFVEKGSNICYEILTIKVYRVKKRDSDETDEQKSDNLLLFHGTNLDNAVGILEKGFKPSAKGIRGSGVYVTASSRSAIKFSSKKISKLYKEKENFILVNEIIESKKLKEISVSLITKNEFIYSTIFTLILYPVSHLFSYLFFIPFALLLTFVFTLYIKNQPRKRKFERYIVKTTAPKNSDKHYEEDSIGRKIKVFNATVEDESNHYVCDENLVIPRYLVKCSTKYH